MHYDWKQIECGEDRCQCAYCGEFDFMLPTDEKDRLQHLMTDCDEFAARFG